MDEIHLHGDTTSQENFKGLIEGGDERTPHVQAPKTNVHKRTP